MRWEHSIEIATPPQSLWRLTLAVEDLPTITPTTMTWVERLDPGELRPGSRVRLKQPRQASRVWTVTETDEPRRFVWETSVGPARMVASHLIEPAGEGARNTLRLDLTGPGSALLGRLLGGRLATVLATENAGFKRVAEAADAPGPTS